MIVERLYMSPEHGAPLVGRRRLQLVADRGILGDRHFGKQDWPGQSLSLVEAEEIEAIFRPRLEALAAKYPYQRAYLPVNRQQHDGTLWHW